MDDSKTVSVYGKQAQCIAITEQQMRKSNIHAAWTASDQVQCPLCRWQQSPATAIQQTL